MHDGADTTLLSASGRPTLTRRKTSNYRARSFHYPSPAIRPTPARPVQPPSFNALRRCRSPERPSRGSPTLMSSGHVASIRPKREGLLTSGNVPDPNPSDTRGGTPYRVRVVHKHFETHFKVGGQVQRGEIRSAEVRQGSPACEKRTKRKRRHICRCGNANSGSDSHHSVEDAACMAAGVRKDATRPERETLSVRISAA
ncbi:hypothetical protein Trydic_g21875 [Trypoxylus dichotomus]